MRVFLHFLFFSSCLCAQESLRYDYSSFDPCPDPVKYHIASRTVYVDHCGDSAGAASVDTLTEKFNRQGQVVAQTFFTAPTGFHGSASFGWQFVYDEQGRILRESDMEDTGFYGTTYTYSADGKQVVIHHPPWRGDTTTRFIYYDSHFAIEAEYLLSASGDTLYQSITRGNVTTTIKRYRDYEGLHIADSSIGSAYPPYTHYFSAQLYARRYRHHHLAHGLFLRQKRKTRAGQELVGQRARRYLLHQLYLQQKRIAHP